MSHSNLKILVFVLLFSTVVNAGRHIDDADLWKHVVTVDRLVWNEREGQKKINDMSGDRDFARRVYIDITGKIPTYQQLVEFVNSKAIDKRQKLIEKLLDSPGYVSHYSTFWLDLLRNSYRNAEDYRYKEYTRFTERFLTENWTYDKIVNTLLMANGSVNENPAIAFYNRDSGTDFMDTFNATTRVFLGTRLGCAQCHNHRFDKWTQKEFYEAAAHLHGVEIGEDMSNRAEDVNKFHVEAMVKDKRFQKISGSDQLSSFARRIFFPSIAIVKFSNGKKSFKYPETYAYDNAKPGEVVVPRIVFDYGPKKPKGETPRERFSNWMTSKENEMFARVMPNRLWKRIMGVANMDPIDDYKDSIEIQNKKLFETLGEVFIAVDYDFKALLSVIFNSEAYQYSYDPKNNFEVEDYKVQGAKLKRMSAQQLNDSLKTLRYGDLDRFSRFDSEYFEFEDKLNELTMEYKKEFVPEFNKIGKKYGTREAHIDDGLIEKMLSYMEKYEELKDYYQIQDNGYIKGKVPVELSKSYLESSKNSRKKNKQESNTMMAGSMAHGPAVRKGTIERSNRGSSDFMMVFGALDRSAPESTVETGATMKQILKLMNSKECQSAVAQDSVLMKNAMQKTKFDHRVDFLYLSLFSRPANATEKKIAAQFLQNDLTNFKLWSKYTLALLNSPEFYFIK